MERSVNVMIARFPGNNSEHPASAQWVIDTSAKIAKDPRVKELTHWYKSDTPITIVRNEAVEVAKARGADLLLMIDSDMKPDHIAPDVKSDRPFWDSSFDWWWEHAQQTPAMIAAPYVGPAPNELPYIFRWKTHESGHPNPDWKLELFDRESAAERAGFEHVPALPTGLILIDMRVFSGFTHEGRNVKLEPPYFYYEYHNKIEAAKASTEDVTFTRDSHLLGVQVVCNWDAWAIHVKLKECCKPQLLPKNAVGDSYKRALDRLNSDESVVILGNTSAPRPPHSKQADSPQTETHLHLSKEPLKVLRPGASAMQRLDVEWFDGCHGMPSSVQVPAGGPGVVVACEILQGTSYPIVAPANAVRHIVDVGANVGLSTLYFKAHYPDAEIDAFEPDHAMAAVFDENVRSMPGVTLHPKALWDREETREFFRHPINPLEHSLLERPHLTPGGPVLCVDAAQALAGKWIDILKIDTEGAEVRILQRLIPDHPEISVVYVECHSSSDRDAVCDLLDHRWRVDKSRSLGDEKTELVFVPKPIAVARKGAPKLVRRGRRSKK